MSYPSATDTKLLAQYDATLESWGLTGDCRVEISLMMTAFSSLNCSSSAAKSCACQRCFAAFSELSAYVRGYVPYLWVLEPSNLGFKADQNFYPCRCGSRPGTSAASPYCQSRWTRSHPSCWGWPQTPTIIQDASLTVMHTWYDIGQEQHHNTITTL